MGPMATPEELFLIKDDHIFYLVQRHYWPFCQQAQFCQVKTAGQGGTRVDGMVESDRE